MAALRIDKGFLITGGFLKKKQVTWTDTFEEDGRTYFHLSGCHPQTPTLLGLPHRLDGQRIMARTDIIEQIRALKDEQYETMMQQKMPKPKNDSVMKLFDSGSPSTLKSCDSKARKTAMLSMPRSFIVQAPDVGEVKGIGIRVKADPKTSKLFIELNVENLTYVSDACKYQLTQCSIHRRHARDNTDLVPYISGLRGVHNVYEGPHRGKIKVVRKTNPEKDDPDVETAPKLAKCMYFQRDTPPEVLEAAVQGNVSAPCLIQRLVSKRRRTSQPVTRAGDSDTMDADTKDEVEEEEEVEEEDEVATADEEHIDNMDADKKDQAEEATAEEELTDSEEQEEGSAREEDAI